MKQFLPFFTPTTTNATSHVSLFALTLIIVTKTAQFDKNNPV